MDFLFQKLTNDLKVFQLIFRFPTDPELHSYLDQTCNRAQFLDPKLTRTLKYKHEHTPDPNFFKPESGPNLILGLIISE